MYVFIIRMTFKIKHQEVLGLSNVFILHYKNSITVPYVQLFNIVKRLSGQNKTANQ